MKPKTSVKKPKTPYRKQLELQIITDLKNENNNYEGFGPSDFQEGTAENNGLDIIDLKVSGKKHNILTFQVEGYFKDVTAAAIKFSESFDPVDYTISDLDSAK